MMLDARENPWAARSKSACHVSANYNFTLKARSRSADTARAIRAACAIAAQKAGLR